jgi:putative sigma-54 modulation protein
MNVIIQSIHFDADQKLTSFISTKTQKLVTYYDSILDAQVYLRLEKDHQHGNKVVELKLNVPNTTLMASERGHTFEEATDNMIDQMKRQLTKYKEKHRV